MNSFIYGILASLIMIAAFCLGCCIGGRDAQTKKQDVPLTKAEKERIRENRRRLEEEQAAFSMLIGYGPDVAYGIRDGYYDSGRKE